VQSGEVDLPDPSNLFWVEVRSPAAALAQPLVTNLGPGETQVLMLALEISGSIAILDDRFARRVAEVRGIPVVGTLGLKKSAVECLDVNLKSVKEKIGEGNSLLTDSDLFPIRVHSNDCAVFCGEDLLADPIHQGDSADDGADGHYRLRPYVDHRRRGDAPLLQLVDDIRPDSGALTARKYQNLAADIPSEELMFGVDDLSRLRVYGAEEGYRLPRRQGGSRGPSPRYPVA